MYKAHLIGVYDHGEVPEGLQGFVRFQAHRERYEPKKGDKVAILQIVGTTSYFPIFLNKIAAIEQVEESLKEAEAVLDHVSRLSMQRILQEKNI